MHRKSKILIIEYKISHSTRLNVCLYQSKMQKDLWRIMEFYTNNIKYTVHFFITKCPRSFFDVVYLELFTPVLFFESFTPIISRWVSNLAI